MKSLDTLVEDIKEVLTKPNILSDLTQQKFGLIVADIVTKQLRNEERTELSMSMLGSKCDRQLQYKLNPLFKIAGEPLGPSAKLKFMYGDLIEALVLLLAKEAGHDIRGEQETLELYGIKGHRDCIIDNVLVDVKSASSFSFYKFKEGLNVSNDNFGYLSQLSVYHNASVNTDSLIDLNRAAFLVVDKQFGHICLDIHDMQPYANVDWKEKIESKKALLASRTLSPRSQSDEPDGKSGNRKLNTVCSYCSFKRNCWPGLQVFNYASGPRFLTRVVRVPDVERF